MPCKHYKDALIEAAAADAEPRGELRSHLAGCADCSATFEQEQSLFASIDAGLHVTANAEVPGSFLPRVRASIDGAVASQRRWFQQWVLAPASVALIFAIFLLVRPHHSRPDSQARQAPQIPVRETPVKNDRHQNSSEGAQIVSSNVRSSQTRGHSTRLKPAASSQPEVLVPPDEREAFARFVAILGERREVARALVTPTTDERDGPAGLKPLQIDRLDVKPLEGTESERSEEAGQEQ